MVTADRNTLINVEKGSVGIGLSTADLQTLSAFNILQPARAAGRNTVRGAINPQREKESWYKSYAKSVWTQGKK